MGGVPATMTIAISGGTGSSLTFTDQGAGYTSVPIFTVVRDIRDTTGSGMTISATLTGAGGICAVLVADHGNPQTALPTLRAPTAARAPRLPRPRSCVGP